MPDWNELLSEIQRVENAPDAVRRKYLKQLNDITGRNVIIYYSGWLQKPNAPDLGIDDYDKVGFMSAIHGLDRSKGLDLILHTPGGDTAAVESIVDYLRRMFGADIRAIIPQLAMSGGTMIACACKSILMGKHSSLGPIDPQFNGIPAHGVIEEFDQARDEIVKNPATIPLWQPIIAKYHPTFIGDCKKAIEWSEELVEEWLSSGMLANDPDKVAKISTIIDEFGDHAITKSHARHLHIDKCRDTGLVIENLEDDQDLQEAVLTLHHACTHTLGGTNAT